MLFVSVLHTPAVTLPGAITIRSRGKKRAFDDGELRIKLAIVDWGTADPLEADRTILAAFSSCIRGLPAEADEWDISQLLIEGQPVQRQTVVAWLNMAYSQALDEPFEQDTELDDSMAGLAQLLAFADAVGPTKGLLRACLSDRGELYAYVTVPEGESEGESDAGSEGEDAEEEQVGLSIDRRFY